MILRCVLGTRDYNSILLVSGYAKEQLFFKNNSSRQFFGLLTALDFHLGHVFEEESSNEYFSNVYLSSARILGLFPHGSFFFFFFF